MLLSPEFEFPLEGDEARVGVEDVSEYQELIDVLVIRAYELAFLVHVDLLEDLLDLLVRQVVLVGVVEQPLEVRKAETRRPGDVRLLAVGQGQKTGEERLLLREVILDRQLAPLFLGEHPLL